MSLGQDMHLHSTFSVDAHDTIVAMCKAAIEKGMKAICFTEHLDLHPQDQGYNHFNYEAFSKTIEQARKKFGTQIEILKGVEFGEPHLYQEAFTQVLEKDYDVVVGAVHRIGGYLVGMEELQERYSKVEIFEKYYREVLRAVQFGGFDVLAHIDLPKRYMNISLNSHAVLNAILEKMIDSRIVLEINTSPLRRGGSECCPDKPILLQYIDKGGKQVTVGSDAHTTENIGNDFHYVKQEFLNRLPLQVGIFRKRKFVPLHKSET